MKTIILFYPPYSPDFTPCNFLLFLEQSDTCRVVDFNLQIKLKVHHRLNERAWPNMDSRHASINFTGTNKNVLLHKCLNPKEDIFLQFNSHIFYLIDSVWVLLNAISLFHCSARVLYVTLLRNQKFWQSVETLRFQFKFINFQQIFFFFFR